MPSDSSDTAGRVLLIASAAPHPSPAAPVRAPSQIHVAGQLAVVLIVGRLHDRDGRRAPSGQRHGTRETSAPRRRIGRAGKKRDGFIETPAPHVERHVVGRVAVPIGWHGSGVDRGRHVRRAVASSRARVTFNTSPDAMPSSSPSRWRLPPRVPDGLGPRVRRSCNPTDWRATVVHTRRRIREQRKSPASRRAWRGHVDRPAFAVTAAAGTSLKLRPAAGPAPMPRLDQRLPDRLHVFGKVRPRQRPLAFLAAEDRAAERQGTSPVDRASRAGHRRLHEARDALRGEYRPAFEPVRSGHEMPRPSSRPAGWRSSPRTAHLGHGLGELEPAGQAKAIDARSDRSTSTSPLAIAWASAATSAYGVTFDRPSRVRSATVLPTLPRHIQELMAASVWVALDPAPATPPPTAGRFGADTRARCFIAWAETPISVATLLTSTPATASPKRCRHALVHHDLMRPGPARPPSPDVRTPRRRWSGDRLPRLDVDRCRRPPRKPCILPKPRAYSTWTPRLDEVGAERQTTSASSSVVRVVSIEHERLAARIHS